MTGELSLTLKLMGHVECHAGEARLIPAESGLKPCALLAYVAMETALGRVHRLSRTQLADLFWPFSTDERRARNSLSQALHRLRTALGDTKRLSGQRIICSDVNSVWLNQEIILHIDVIIFLRCLQQAEREAVEFGLSLYRKRFLADIDPVDCPEFGDWRAHHQARLKAAALSAGSTLTEICIEQGDWLAATENAYRQLELDRTTEAAYRQLMRIHAHCNQREAAIAHYLRCVEVLQTDLEVDPERTTVELFESIVNDTFSSSVSPAVSINEMHGAGAGGRSAPTQTWIGLVDVHPPGLELIAGYDLWFSCQATGRWQIWHLDSEEGRPHPVEFEPISLLNGSDQYAPSVSPDGTQLVFAAGTRTHDRMHVRNLYLADTASQQVQRLTTSPLDNYRPVWLPHGRLLAYHAGLARTERDPGIAFGIYVFDLCTGQCRQVTQEMDYDPCWSPNGRYIAYHSLEDECTIKILDYDTYCKTGGMKAIWVAVQSADRATSPCWIHDHRVVFSCLSDGHWQIFSIPVKPHKSYRNPDQLTHSKRNNVYPRVFDAKIMLWQAFPHESNADEGDATDKDAEIWVMDLDKGVETPLIVGVGNIRDGFLVRRPGPLPAHDQDRS